MTTANITMIIFIKFMLCIVSAHVYMSTCRGMPMSERIVTPLFGIAMPFCRDYDRVEFLQAVFVSYPVRSSPEGRLKAFCAK